jgi:NAD(P)-dependent dehydrogenase (short-subunit alcohol dehydrogenase family)
MGMLDGKVAIVTGAGNGVGRGEAIMLADHGAKVVVNDLGGSVSGEGSDKRAADNVVDVIKQRGGEAVAPTTTARRTSSVPRSTPSVASTYWSTTPASCATR